MSHACGTVTPLDLELIRVGGAIGQRARRRGLVQGWVRPVPVAEVLVLAQDDHQMPLIPYKGLVQQLTPQLLIQRSMTESAAPGPQSG